MAEYNDTRHRTIAIKPKDVGPINEVDVMQRFNVERWNKTPRIFKVRDKVRISKYKHVFEKGYMPNRTTEVFTVDKVKRTVPHTYLLKDYQGKPIAGEFYEQELQKTYHPDDYLIENVLKKQGNRLFVK